MSTQAERSYQTKLQAHIEAFGYYHLVQIPDAGLARIRKKYDFGLAREGQYHACELKQVHSTEWAWPFRKLEDHQEENLLDAVKKGNYGWVFVHHVAQLSKANYKKYGIAQYDRLWVLPINMVLVARDIDGLGGLYPALLDVYGTCVAKGHAFNHRAFLRATANYPRTLDQAVERKRK